jgi:hypothetical protein
MKTGMNKTVVIKIEPDVVLSVPLTLMPTPRTLDRQIDNISGTRQTFHHVLNLE